MDEIFEMRRGERRSFFCPNKLWKEILKQVGDEISVSSYIRAAIIEKMMRENPKLEQIIEKLIE